MVRNYKRKTEKGTKYTPSDLALPWLKSNRYHNPISGVKDIEYLPEYNLRPCRRTEGPDIPDSTEEYFKQEEKVTPFRDGRPTSDWLTKFIRRNNLSLKKFKSVEIQRRNYVDPFIIYGYFDKIPPAAFISEDYNMVSLDRLDVFHANDIERTANQNQTSVMKTLGVHQRFSSGEFINAADIKIEMVLPNGPILFAEDFGGVFQDAISKFWALFYDKCTMGANVGVPYLRHDFGKKQWKAIANIFVKEFQLGGFMSIQLASMFFENCFRREIENTFLNQDFPGYISESEADIVKTALNDFDSVGNKDVLDFCSSYDASWIPSSKNIEQIFENDKNINYPSIYWLNDNVLIHETPYDVKLIESSVK
ncbi:hypothetical protein JTB14_008185 [Gonioctena quinquepunctata]|nr:hypothetical protein JTB14_008185 [Gonioctena quinquepunctata]